MIDVGPGAGQPVTQRLICFSMCLDWGEKPLQLTLCTHRPLNAAAKGAGPTPPSGRRDVRCRAEDASKARLSPSCHCLLQDAQPGAQSLPAAATHLCLVAAVLGRAPKDEGV